jgi:hypothetical protein
LNWGGKGRYQSRRPWERQGENPTLDLTPRVIIPQPF